MQITLSDDERSLLTELLNEELGELKEEIHHTDTFEYKERLKSRESLMTGLLAKLGGSAATSA